MWCWQAPVSRTNSSHVRSSPIALKFLRAALADDPVRPRTHQAEHRTRPVGRSVADAVDPGDDRLHFRIVHRQEVLSARVELGSPRLVRQRHQQQRADHRLTRHDYSLHRHKVQARLLFTPRRRSRRQLLQPQRRPLRMTGVTAGMIWFTAKKCTGRSRRLPPESEGTVPNAPWFGVPGSFVYWWPYIPVVVIRSVQR